MVMWSHVSEFFRFADDDVVSLGAEERAGGQLNLGGADYLHEFRLEDGLPVWTYHVRDLVLEKRILLPHLQNTVHVIYRILEGEKRPRLELRPAFHFRHHESPVNEGLPAPYKFSADRRSLRNQWRRQRIATAAHEAVRRDIAQFHVSPPSHSPGRLSHRTEPRLRLRRELSGARDFFKSICSEHNRPRSIASTEKWEIIDVLAPEEALAAEHERRARLLDDAIPEARQGFPAELVFAADQFVITPAGRFEEAARAHAAGDEVRTVIAGYHWFTDWGRDTMISLEGLTLVTGRCLEAGYILAHFRALRPGWTDPEHVSGWREGRALSYCRRDALVFSRARSLSAVHRRSDHAAAAAADLDRHRRASSARARSFNIHVDPKDGLLVQGQEGYQLTWMDAKMGDWVVTPRRGKAVEINALWYNALASRALVARGRGRCGATL